MARKRSCIIIAACGLTVALAACTAGDSPPRPAALQSPPAFSLPQPAGLLESAPRLAAFTDSDRRRRGADFDSALANHVSASTDDALFTPAGDDPAGPLAAAAYALYRFELPGYADSPLVRVSWAGLPPDDGQGWIALGNQQQQRWDWFSLPESGQLSVDSLLPYLEAEQLLLVVLVTGSGEAQLEQVMVGDDVIPLASLSATPDSGDFPLLVVFSATGSSDSDGSLVKYEWDLDGDGAFELDSGTDAEVEFTYAAQGSFSAGLRVTDDRGATATDVAMVSVNDPDMDPPLADLQADPPDGTAPLTVTLDASASSDDLGIVNYDFDTDGDGIFDVIDSPQATTQVDYNAGLWQPSVRVEDAQGATDTATIQVDADGLLTAILAVTPDCGSGSRTLDATASYEEAGQIVSYRWDYTADGIWDSTSSEAKQFSVSYYWGTHTARVEVTDDDGDTAVGEFAPIHSTYWNSSAKLLGSGPGAGLSAREINDGRSMLYDANGVMYARDQGAGYQVSAKNPPDTSRMQLAATLGIGGVQYPVAVFYNSDGDLVCARSTKSNPAVAADWNVHNIDSASSNYTGGNYLGLATVGLAGNARILVSYFDTSDGELYFAVSETAYPDAEADWTRHIVASQNGIEIGSSQSLLIVGGKPVIAYSYGSAALYYARSAQILPDSSDDWVFHLVHNPGTYAGISLALLSGVPAVSFTRSGTLYFGYANAAEPADFGDWTIHSLRAGCGWHTGLCSANGAPVIVFTDTSGGFGHFIIGTAIGETLLPAAADQWCLDQELFAGYGLSSLQVSGSVFNGLPLVACYYDIGGDRAYNLWGVGS